jgi:hypothetical protein
MLRAVRLFLFFLSLFLFFVKVDPFAAMISFLFLLGTFHYLLWGRAMELENQEGTDPEMPIDSLEMERNDPV